MVERVTVEAHSSPNPSLEEQAAALEAQQAAKAAGQQQTPADQQAGKILGKFENQQALETGYSELERRNTQMAQELAELKKGKAPPADPKDGQQPPKEGEEKKDPPANQDEARQVAENAGVDFDGLNAHYREHGELTEEHYADLEKRGIPKAMVDSYIAGQRAISDQLEADCHAALGGADNYSAMTDWARSALSEDEIKLFNAEVASGDKTRTLFAVNNLKSRFQQAEGREPNRQVNGGAAASGTDVFESWAQVSAAMRTPAYRTDPAERAKIEAKLARSGNLK